MSVPLEAARLVPLVDQARPVTADLAPKSLTGGSKSVVRLKTWTIELLSSLPARARRGSDMLGETARV
eukprot:scaffold553846_cov31-Prasinocladus_malaysianus.AAC.1